MCSAYSRVESSDLCGGGLTEKLVRSIYDSALSSQRLGSFVPHNPLKHRAESPGAPSTRYLRCRAGSGAHRGRCLGHRAPSRRLRTLQIGICPSSVLCSRVWWPRVGVPVFILPVLDQQGASPGGRRACRQEWAQRASVHEARRRQPCQVGEGGCQIVV